MTKYPLIFLLFVLWSCQGDEQVSTDMINFPQSADGTDTDKLPIIVFEDTTFHFGSILEGEKVQFRYRFTNEGKSPLVLSRIETSCGCTASKSWPREPINPGDSGEIEIEFDSNQRAGHQQKTISVIANTFPATTILYLEGEVKGPEPK